MGYPVKNHLNPNLVETHSSITSISFAQSFWNFAQSMAVPLPCSVQTFTVIKKLQTSYWQSRSHKIWGLRWVSEGYPILIQPPGPCVERAHLWQAWWCQPTSQHADGCLQLWLWQQSEQQPLPPPQLSLCRHHSLGHSHAMTNESKPSDQHQVDIDPYVGSMSNLLRSWGPQ